MQRLITACFFCVPHSDEYDRLILDRPPLNHGANRQQWMRLPLGRMLCKIVIGPRKTGVGSVGICLHISFS